MENLLAHDLGAENSTHSDFPRYDRDQMTMYNRIVAATNAKIDTNDRIFGVIPAGTAVQNARTSYIGDNLTADGYHLNENGEFIAGLTWIHKITGFDLDRMDETLIPAQFLDRLDIYKESVENAVADPYRITQSQYTEAPVVATFPVIDFEEIKDGMQYRNQPVTNWVDLTEAVASEQHNVVDLNDNRVFAFQPMSGTNLYGFRHNFQAGAFSGCTSLKFDLAVADSAAAGEYTYKIFLYYGNANTEITSGGGSAYDIGNDAIRAACRAESGIGPDTMLKKLFLEELKTETVTENLAYFYSVSKIGIASYAPLVFKAFKAGDRVAAEILKDNMRNVAELMVAGRKKSDSAAPVFVVIAGGLTAESEILLPFIEENIALTDNPDNFEISVFRGDAVCGALMLAGLGSVKEES